jgi:hypothetical protein
MSDGEAAYWRGSRDLRLDFLRGLCLLKMVFSHGLRTPLHAPVSRIGFVSAAEGFFFISGMVLGLVYRKRLSQMGLRAASGKLLRRALLLWLANFALVLLYAAWDYSGRRWGFFHLGYTYDWVFWNDWHWYSLFSSDQPYFLQILPRYALFLALSPAALWLLARGRWAILLAITWCIYLLEHVPDVELMIPLLEHGREVGFRHSAWQVLFFTGMVIGYERDRLRWIWDRLTRPRVLAVMFAIAAAGVGLQYAMESGRIALPPRIEYKLFARDVIGVARLPNLLAVFVVTFWLTTLLWRPLHRGLGWMLLPMGQAALLAFVLHIPLSHLALTLSKLGWLGDGGRWGWRHLLVDLAIIALVWSATWWQARRRAPGRLRGR